MRSSAARPSTDNTSSGATLGNKPPLGGMSSAMPMGAPWSSQSAMCESGSPVRAWIALISPACHGAFGCLLAVEAGSMPSSLATAARAFATVSSAGGGLVGSGPQARVKPFSSALRWRSLKRVLATRAMPSQSCGQESRNEAGHRHPALDAASSCALRSLADSSAVPLAVCRRTLPDEVCTTPSLACWSACCCLACWRRKCSRTSPAQV